MSNAQPPRNIARDGAGKNAPEIPIAHGHRNRAAPGAASPLTGQPEHAGVQPLEDAENFTTKPKRLYDKTNAAASDILNSAVVLGQKK
jgi:hypothetical protein